MPIKLADARRSLIRAKDSAKKRLEELDIERREIKASLKSLDAALKALGRSNHTHATTHCSEALNQPGQEATDDAS